MEIYVAHSHILTSRNGRICKYKRNSKESDIIIAEVSYPATGMGIELGWANDANK